MERLGICTSDLKPTRLETGDSIFFNLETKTLGLLRGVRKLYFYSLKSKKEEITRRDTEDEIMAPLPDSEAEMEDDCFNFASLIALFYGFSIRETRSVSKKLIRYEFLAPELN